MKLHAWGESESEKERKREMPHKCTLLNDTSAVNYVRVVVMVALFNYLTVSITISNDHKSSAGALSLSHITHTHSLSHTHNRNRIEESIYYLRWWCCRCCLDRKLFIHLSASTFSVSRQNIVYIMNGKAKMSFRFASLFDNLVFLSFLLFASKGGVRIIANVTNLLNKHYFAKFS